MKTVFLDRDGVINMDRPDYIKKWAEFQFQPKSLEAIELLTINGYQVIVITNQSVINRKLVSESGLNEIHDNMIKAIEAHGGRITSLYYCPHLPSDECGCRKPEPGLILRAQREHNIDLSQTAMIGDSLKDLMCARKAGCAKVLLVRTGNGEKTQRAAAEQGVRADHVANDLYDAVQWLLTI